MRTFLSILFLGFICAVNISWLSPAMGPSGSGTPVSPTCTTPTNSSELDEGFIGNGDGYENANWSETGTVNPDFTLSGSPPESSCEEGLNVNISQATAYAQWDKQAVIDAGTVVYEAVCEVYIDSAVLDSYTYGYIIVWSAGSDPSTNQNWYVALRCNSGSQCNSGSLQFSFMNDSGSRVGISMDTWYTVRVAHNLGGTSYFQVTGGGNTTCDGPTECSVTPNDIDARYLSLGAIALWTQSGEALDIEFGYCSIDIP